VLTLLYDKTFPPKPASASSNIIRGLSAHGQRDARQFNYHAQPGAEGDEEDVEKLQREIEEVMKGGGDLRGDSVVNLQEADEDIYEDESGEDL